MDYRTMTIDIDLKPSINNSKNRKKVNKSRTNKTEEKQSKIT